MPEETNRFFCNECRQETKHLVKGSLQKEYNVPPMFYSKTKYYIAECRGCENVSFVQEASNSENYEYIEDEEGDWKAVYHVTTKIYPPVTKRHLPEWLEDLPDAKLKIIMKETYWAFNTDSHFLAAFGSRTLIDRLIVLTVGDQGNFQKGLKKLEDEQMLSAFESMQIKPIIDAGHAVAHRGWIPKEQQLATMLTTIEGLIYRLHVLPKLSEQLKDSIPARSSKKFSKNRQVNTKFTGGIVTAEQKIKLANSSLKNLFNDLEGALKAFGEDISVHHTKHYTAFRRKRNFASVQLYLQKQEIKVYLNIDPDDINLERGFSRDVRAIGHFGPGDLEIVMRKTQDIEKARELFKQSYLAS